MTSKPITLAAKDAPWVLAASILGSSMAFVDGTAVNVALPALQSSLKASLSEVQWVVESFTLFLGALLLTGGSLGDLFGQRRVFCAGVIVFAAASIFCGMASNVEQLIVARGIQGIGGALLVPTSLALLSVTYSREELGKAIGIWSGFTSITAAVGPLLGGWLAQHASWRWVFAINVPIAAAVILISFWKIPNTERNKGTSRPDWLGSLLATVGLGVVVYGFLQSSWMAGVIGALSLAAFVFVEGKVTAPMLPFALFKSSDFTGTQLLTLFLYGALSGAMFFLPLNLVQIQHYSETAAGASLLPLILLIAFLSRWSATLLTRFDARVLLISGPLIAALGLGLFCLPTLGGSYWTTFFPGIVVLGLGMAVTVAPLTTTVMNSVDKEHSGIASGVNNAVSRVAGLIAVAVFGLALSSVFNPQLDSRLNALHVSPDRIRAIDNERSKLAAISSTGVEETAIKASFVDGFRLVMILSCGLCIAGALSSAIFIKAKPLSRSA